MHQAGRGIFSLNIVSFSSRKILARYSLRMLRFSLSQDGLIRRFFLMSEILLALELSTVIPAFLKL